MRFHLAFLWCFMSMVCHGASPPTNPPRLYPRDEEPDHNRPPAELVNHTSSPTSAPATVKVFPTNAPGKPPNPKRVAPHRGRVRGSTLPPTPSPTACIGAPVICFTASFDCDGGSCRCNVTYSVITIVVTNPNSISVYVDIQSLSISPLSARTLVFNNDAIACGGFTIGVYKLCNDQPICTQVYHFPA